MNNHDKLFFMVGVMILEDVGCNNGISFTVGSFFFHWLLSLYYDKEDTQPIGGRQNTPIQKNSCCSRTLPSCLSDSLWAYFPA
jgi:hypothetical protein